MRKLIRNLVWLVLVWGAVWPVAQGATEEKPFAAQRVVLQLSDNDAGKQTLVLNVANNLLKAYGVDRVEVEIVAFGPGLNLLLANNTNAARIDGLAGSGVRFSACQNTLAAMTREQGKEPVLTPHAVKVSAGVVRIIELEGQGYTLIRP
ncbi:MAG TPA: hypothetical protein VGE00_10800 [Gammaproteobacteria bacterium]